MRSLGCSLVRIRPTVASLVVALQTCRPSCSTRVSMLVDWRCGNCGFCNHDFRTDCFQCHRPNPRPEALQLIDDDDNEVTVPGEDIVAAGQAEEQPGLTTIEAEAWLPASATSSRALSPPSSLALPATPGFVAPGAAKSTVHMPFKTGDWMCVCGQHNFARRAECMNCGRARRSFLPGMTSVTAWTCLACYSVNPGDNRLCAICGAARGEPTDMHEEVTASSGDPQRRPVAQSADLGRANHDADTSLPAPGRQAQFADWVCTECGFVNFASRGRCKRCSAPHTASSGTPVTAALPSVGRNNPSSQRSPETMWRCDCGYENYHARQFCRKCGHRHRGAGVARHQV